MARVRGRAGSAESGAPSTARPRRRRTGRGHTTPCPWRTRSEGGEASDRERVRERGRPRAARAGARRGVCGYAPCWAHACHRRARGAPRVRAARSEAARPVGRSRMEGLPTASPHGASIACHRRRRTGTSCAPEDEGTNQRSSEVQSEAIGGPIRHHQRFNQRPSEVQSEAIRGHRVVRTE